MFRRIPWSILLLLLTAPAANAQKSADQLPPLWRPLDVEGMDLAYKPWEDFYEFANGKWLAKFASLPTSRASMSSLSCRTRTCRNSG